jgi:hypothetical protein
MEHGAAWLSTDDHVLEWSGANGGLLVFSTTTAQRSDGSRHLVDVSRERTLELWQMLAEGRLGELERQPWLPGNGWRPDPQREARLAGATRDAERAFYESLGAERTTRAASARAADAARSSGACSAGLITSSRSEARPARSTIESGGAKPEAGLPGGAAWSVSDRHSLRRASSAWTLAPQGR